jgi:release factor glutamine methyltransferase
VHRPQWTAEQLLAERLGCLPVDLYAMAPKLLEGDLLLYRADVAARANGVPLQYLLGTADFYGRRFAVGPGVFNPRPETEILIETVLDLLAVRAGSFDSAGHSTFPIVLSLSKDEGDRPAQDERFRIVDVGTGSGAIAVTLAKEWLRLEDASPRASAQRPELEMVAVERSSVAFHCARRNAAVHGCAVRFLLGNLLEGFAPESVDAIVANPPYLNPAQAKSWPRELAWEPWLALDGGEEGIEITAKLIRHAARALKPSGWMALEIGMDQAKGVRGLAEQNGFYVDRIVQDLAGLDRVAVLWKN